MRVGHSDLIFCYSFDRLTPDGLLYDHGPLALHATPGAAGAAPVRQLDGSYLFSGAQYFALSGASQARFYANAPTGAHTWLWVASCTYAGGANIIFNAADINAGNWYGIAALTVETAPLRQMAMTGYATAVTNYVHSVRAFTIANKVSVSCVTVEASPRGMQDGTATTGSWGGGGNGTVVYRTAVEPRIGGSALWTPLGGRLYYLALLRGAVSSADMAELSAMMMNATSGTSPWPFCTR